ncbi:MupA/Atu3671 family FMN-dependent luciferase-like monooxygenase [Endothiovibrio diazotrophicus]
MNNAPPTREDGPAAAHRLLRDLEAKAVQLWVEGEKLRCRAPEGVLAPALFAEIQRHKDALLEILQRREHSYPLSLGQRALWFIHQLAPENPAYNVMYALRLIDGLEPATLERAARTLLERHPSLRTTYHYREEGPIQQVRPADDFSADYFVQVDGDADRRDWRRWAEEEADRPFDLENGPVLRLRLWRQAADKAGEPHTFILLVVIHHIVADLVSLRVVLEELEMLYRALLQDRAPAAAPPFSYRDYVTWESDHLQRDGARLEAYWLQQLAGELAPLNLPTDRPRPPVQTYFGAEHTFTLDAELNRQLRALARANDVTLYVVMLAAFQVLLHRYSGQQDILVGTPVDNRSEERFARTIGYYVNPVVLRTELSGELSFAALLPRVRDVVLGAIGHKAYPFPLLVEKLQPERDPSRSPIFQVEFIWDQFLAPIYTTGELVAETLHTGQRGSEFDLSLTIFDMDDALKAGLRYNRDLFDAGTIERMGRYLTAVLEGVVADPARPIAELPLMDEAERRRILLDWNDTAREYPRHQGVHTLFEEQAARTPQATALLFDERKGAAPLTLTYRELNERANRLAHHLLALGVEAETLVGIYLERSPELLVALLGVLKAGAAYLPMDPDYPAERVAYMLENSAAPIVLTRQARRRDLPAQGATIVEIDGDGPAIAQRSAGNPARAVDPHQLAYVIYTSGSTGKPKGVMVCHNNVVNFFAGMDERIPHEAGDTWLAVTSLSFDISVLELFWTLTRGLRVVLYARPDAAPSAARAGAPPDRPIDFSLFYFAREGDGEEAEPGSAYRLLLDGARFADEHGFAAVWTPERHFHAFGGAYPNPAITSAAIAAVTRRVQLRAGSCVLPLHHPIRVAEEWGLVDNLSNGRVGIGFAAGWQPNDFVLQPTHHAERGEIMFREIETVKRLWRGEAVDFPGVRGEAVPVRTFPRPVQAELPVWITASGNPETFRRAGEGGYHILTHLLNQDFKHLEENLRIYRSAWTAAGHAGAGQATVMLHTFVGEEVEAVRETVRQPMTDYLRSASHLVGQAAWSLAPVQPRAGETAEETAGRYAEERIGEEDMETLLALAFDRYFEGNALFGTPQSCLGMVDRLKAIGVDEIACLIDFGVPGEQVLEHLGHLDRLRVLANAEGARADGEAAGAAAGEEERYSIPELIERHQVTHFQCTPSMATMLLEEGDPPLHRLKAMMVGGEALPAALAERLKRLLAGDLVNMYGPTETTIWSSTHRVNGSTPPGLPSVPIGRPIANTRMYIVDERLQPVPVDLPGELIIGGDGVARGYLHQPELTRQRFIELPRGHWGAPAGANGETTGDDAALQRLYRTGDLARYLPNGDIEFLGRNDFQVKIRGHRIELGEIEAVLGQHPAVREAVVAARQDSGGEPRLVAYVVAAQAGPPAGDGRPDGVDPEGLRKFLEAKLPNYMIPSAFVPLAALPLTLNGKTDRRALPAVDPKELSAQLPYTPPRTPTEQVVAELYGEVLNVDQVGIHHNFFALGGHSLLATRAIVRIRDRFQTSLPLHRFFEKPTVAQIAEHIDDIQLTQSLQQAPGNGTRQDQDQRQRGRL